MVAHSSPPRWLFQLRNFGTPLLIIASALTYSFLYANINLDIKRFYKKRLSRLVLPAWIFLSFFFSLVFVAVNIINIDYPFSIFEVVTSFAFLSGIGYVWIFKVYIILAFITPFALMLNNLVKSDFKYFAGLIVAYVLYEVLVVLILPTISGNAEAAFKRIIFIVIPYSILYLYGFRLSKLNNSQIIFTALLSLVIFVLLAVAKFNEIGHLVATQHFKYPPTIYYLSYAFFAINLIYLLSKKLKFSNRIYSNVIMWLSFNSLWIYLWHIMAVYIWRFLLPNPNGDLMLFTLKTTFLLGSLS